MAEDGRQIGWIDVAAGAKWKVLRSLNVGSAAAEKVSAAAEKVSAAAEKRSAVAKHGVAEAAKRRRGHPVGDREKVRRGK